MRPLPLALTAILLLAACDDRPDCTQEVLDLKATDLMIKAQAFGAANPDRMAEIGPRVADLVDRTLTATGDLTPLCDEIDKLIGEIGG
jgi:hypothetical protein